MFDVRRSGQISMVKAIVAINVAIFLLQSLLPHQEQVWMDFVFGLSARGFAGGMLWQFITYQFLHANLFHLFVNMVGLWFAGRILENMMGARRFLFLYILCGIAGGVLQLVLNPGPVLVGASAAVCGVVSAFSAFFPEMRITALLFFIIPLNTRAKWIGIAIIVVSLFFSITGLGGNIGHEAHLGGALAGYAFAWLSRQRGLKMASPY